jgi:hypothetical protein
VAKKLVSELSKKKIFVFVFAGGSSTGGRTSSPENLFKISPASSSCTIGDWTGDRGFDDDPIYGDLRAQLFVQQNK